MITSPASPENTDSQSGVLANIIELARLSRLTLLYHVPAATAHDAGREQAAALADAATAVADGDVVVLFDAGSDLAVPDLLAVIEAAVLETAPQAPLAPPMAGPVEALAFWQQSLGVRFLLIMQRFELALSRPDPAFDAELLKLVHDPLDISVLLLMDETAAPLLQRLKGALPELGETFLRLPEASGAAAPVQEETVLPEAPPAPLAASSVSAAPAPRFGPSPFLFDDPAEEAPGQTLQPASEPAEAELAPPAHLRPDPAPLPEEQRQEQRRSRRFSSLVEEAGSTPDSFTLPAEAAPAPFTPPEEAPAGVFPMSAPLVPAPGNGSTGIYPAAVPAFATDAQALPGGRVEPSLQVAQPAKQDGPAAGGRVYRERRPMQVAAWMQKRRSRRRRDTVGIASRVSSSSTVLFVLLAVLAVLGWQMPQLGASADASPRGATVRSAAAKPPQAVAVRGNRYRLSINAAASSAGTGRDTR